MAMVKNVANITVDSDPNEIIDLQSGHSQRLAIHNSTGSIWVFDNSQTNGNKWISLRPRVISSNADKILSASDMYAEYIVSANAITVTVDDGMPEDYEVYFKLINGATLTQAITGTATIDNTNSDTHVAQPGAIVKFTKIPSADIFLVDIYDK